MTGDFRNQRANDLCQCGSGERYKHCHKPLHRTRASRYLEAAREFYLKRWSRNATNHRSLGHYDWMIDQVPEGGKRILDIGIGDGAGVEAILRRLAPEKVIALEENPMCAQRAKSRLAESCGDCSIVERMMTQQITDDSAEYRSMFVRGSIPAEAKVTIVLTDPLFDPFLVEDIAHLGPFDLVTAWLLGSHEAREHSVEVQRLGVSTTTEYRLRVQNAVYDLADKVLASGGVLQMVDRVFHPDLEIMRDELRRSHAEQAEPTTLEISSVSFLPYHEASGASVGLMHGKTGEVISSVEGGQLHLSSVVSRKS
jgi:hypothetical protein